MAETAFGETQVADPYIGTLVQGKYRFVRKLGEGGMGAVYEGENTSIKRKVAIKCLHAHLARNASVVFRFRNEALAATQIGNEHIVDVLDMGQLPDGSFFLVLEFLEGTDLAGLLEKENILPIGRAVRITQQVLSALGAAHRANIVHRDIKPENVFLVKRSASADFVKLLDFGIAKINTDEPSMRTATGSQLGTPYYMPPEQAMGQKDIDSRADLYASAVMLYHCLTARFPFEGDSLPMLMYNICHTDAATIAQHRADLPGELSAIIMRALSKDRDERPATAEEFSASLEPFASMDFAPVQTSGTGLSPQPHTSRATPSQSAASTSAKSATAQRSNTTLGASASAVDIEKVIAARSASSSKLPLILGGVTIAALTVAGTTVALTRGNSNTALAQNIATERSRTTEQPPAQSNGNDTQPAVRPAQNNGALTGPAANERRVHVEIRTTPSAAVVVLDRRLLMNPYDGDVLVNEEVHQLEVSAPGYRTEVRSMMITESQRMHIVLERGAGRVLVESNGQRVRDNGASATPPPNGQQIPSQNPSSATTQPTGHSPATAHPTGAATQPTGTTITNTVTNNSNNTNTNAGSTTNTNTATHTQPAQTPPANGSTPPGLREVPEE